MNIDVMNIDVINTCNYLRQTNNTSKEVIDFILDASKKELRRCESIEIDTSEWGMNENSNLINIWGGMGEEIVYTNDEFNELCGSERSYYSPVLCRIDKVEKYRVWVKLI